MALVAVCGFRRNLGTGKSLSFVSHHRAMISHLGFLSPEVDEVKKQLISQYHELFELSESASALFIRLMQGAKLDPESVRNLTVNALAAKSLELFQSSVILLSRGCIPAARIVCRAQIETAYKLCAIVLTSDGITRYINQEKATRLQKLRCIEKYKQTHPGSGVAPGIDQEIGVLSKDKPTKTEPHVWASLAKMGDFHNLYYQGMSDDTHTNIESLNHYFDDNSSHMIVFGPSDKGLSIVAAACHRTVINAIEKYAVFLGTSVAVDLAALSMANDALEKKYSQ